MIEASWQAAKPTSGSEPTPNGAPVKLHCVGYGIWLVATLNPILGCSVSFSLVKDGVRTEPFYLRALGAVGDATSAKFGDIKLLGDDADLEGCCKGRTHEPREENRSDLHCWRSAVASIDVEIVVVFRILTNVGGGVVI